MTASRATRWATARHACCREFAHINPSTDAWARRILAGQAQTQMVNALARTDARRALELFADGTD